MPVTITSISLTLGLFFPSQVNRQQSKDT